MPYISDVKKLEFKSIRGDLSQLEFAELLGISVRTLQDWEQGRRAPNAAAIALLRLAEAGALKKRTKS